MKTALQVLFGMVWWVTIAVAGLFLGLWGNIQPPGWRAAIAFFLLAGVTQWVSFLTFRHGIALQVLLGLALGAAMADLYVSARVPMWENQSPDGSYIIGWRSAVVFLLLLATTQWISFLAFRRIRGKKGKK
jgi:hypothetical protein